MFKKMILVVMMALVMMVGCGQTEIAKDDVQIYDVVETYDDTMIIETENGEEALQFDGMTESEKYALHVIFVNGEYVGIAD